MFRYIGVDGIYKGNRIILCSEQDRTVFGKGQQQIKTGLDLIVRERFTSDQEFSDKRFGIRIDTEANGKITLSTDI